jgi:hypothetical protein
LLVLFLPCKFLLTLLKIKVRFSHGCLLRKKLTNLEPRLDEGGPDKRPARCSPGALFPQVRAWLFDAAGTFDGDDGLPGLGCHEPDERARLRLFRLRFSASSCLVFFFTEGFS